MDNKHDGSKLIGRREALRFLGVGLGAAGGLVVLGCSKGGGGGGGGGGGAGGGGGGGGGALACADMGNPDAQAKQLRKSLQYKDKSDFPDKVCKTCAQYEPNKFNSPDCGGCKLFGGGVKPEGHCLSYAPIQGAAGAGSTPGAQPPAGGADPAKPPG